MTAYRTRRRRRAARELALCAWLLGALFARARAEEPPGPALVPVLFQIFPADARILVDGVPVEPVDGVVGLRPGRHRVDALAAPGSGLASRAFTIDVRPGMPPVRRALQRLAELRIQAPLGYQVRLDGELLSPRREEGATEEFAVRVQAGLHLVTAAGGRGRGRRSTVELWAGRVTEVRLHPPFLAPAIVLVGVGLVGVAAGATMIGLHGRCSSPSTAPPGEPPNCVSLYDFSLQPDAETLRPPGAGYLALGIGAAAVAAGTIWAAVLAAERPRRREGAALSLSPVVGPSGGALVLQGAF